MYYKTMVPPRFDRGSRSSRLSSSFLLLSTLFLSSSLVAVIKISHFELEAQKASKSARQLSELISSRQIVIFDDSHLAAASARTTDRKKVVPSSGDPVVRRTHKRKTLNTPYRVGALTALSDPPLRSHLKEVSQAKYKASDVPSFDFVVAGFPKCGTSTLLAALRRHTEILMPSVETCSFARQGISMEQAKRELDQTAAELSGTGSELGRKLVFGMKCPGVVKMPNSFSRLHAHSPSLKYIIGLRHPVDMIESFFNYRVTEVYDKKQDKTVAIPRFAEVFRKKKGWKGVSLSAARYDLFLSQLLGKRAPGTERDVKGIRGRGSAPKVFVYALDQLGDADMAPSAPFRRGLQRFLALERPIEKLGQENINHFVGSKAHPETIDICDPQFREIRKDLVSEGRRIAKWIRRELLNNNHVTIADRERFLTSIASWGRDPCASRRRSNGRK